MKLDNLSVYQAVTDKALIMSSSTQERRSQNGELANVAGATAAAAEGVPATHCHQLRRDLEHGCVELARETRITSSYTFTPARKQLDTPAIPVPVLLDANARLSQAQAKEGTTTGG